MNVPVIAAFDFNADSSTVNTSTFELHNPGGSVVPATVTYDVPSRTATLTPSSPLLDVSAYYSVTVVGGASGVKEVGTGLSLDSDVNWSFTTEHPVFQDTVVLSGLTQPTVVRFAPASDGRVFVAEKGGIIKVFDGLDDPDGPDIFADFRDKVHNHWDRGLLGLALHPDFPTTPFVYAHYTYNAPLDGSPFPAWPTSDGTSDVGPGTSGDGPPVSSRLSRLTVGPNNTWDGNELVLINDWPSQYPSHAVGTVEFGPDGALYVSAGDGASFTFGDYGQNDGKLGSDALGDPTNEGGALRSLDLLTSPEDPNVDPVTLDGTIIRIDPATGDALSDNPLFDAFGSNDDPNAERAVAFGLRNPFRFTVRDNGELWIGDVGWQVWEEINVVRNPVAPQLSNFGWPAYEGDSKQSSFDGQNLPLIEDFYSDVASNPALHAEPFFAYRHDEEVDAGSSEPTGSSAVSGLAFYDGANYPAAFDGALFFSDFNRGRVWTMFLGPDGEPDPATISTIVGPAQGPVGLYTDPEGDVYYVDLLGGKVRHIEYFADNQPPTAVIAADSLGGAAPLTVNFDGTGSTDPDAGDTRSYAWDLDGDGQFDDSSLAQPSFTYTTNGSYEVQLRVTDGGGLANTDSLLIQLGDAPTVVIDSPLTTDLFQVNQTINFSGRAYEDGVIDEGQRLPNSALMWTFSFYQATEDNPNDFNIRNQEIFSGVGSGQYVIPNWEFPVYLNVELTATDSDLLKTSQHFRVDPAAVTLSFDTIPSGLALEFNGRAKTGPIDQTVVVNSENTISVPSPQIIGSTPYEFVSWSDGGTQTHSVTAGSQSESLVAIFVATGDTTDDGTGTVTAQGENGLAESKENVFDNDPTTKWLDFANTNPSTRASWIQYQYDGGDKYVVTSYTITSANDQPARDPKNWSLSGSNDGVTFTVLDTRTDEDFANRFETRSFSFFNNTGYNFYRLDITSVADPLVANSVQLAEIELIGTPDRTVSIQATAPNAAEGAPLTTGQFTFSRTGAPSGLLTVNYTIAGSAAATDYAEPLSGSAVIPDGSTAVSLTITPVNDALSEGIETVELTIVPDSNYSVGAQNVATVTIADSGNVPVGSDTTDDGTGTITAQGENAATGESKEQAFDNNANTKWLDFSAANPSTRASWIQYQYAGGDKYVVTSYTITSANDAPARDPKNWSLRGSNDGVNFTVLDTRTNEVFPNRFQTRTFSFFNGVAYNFYRLEIASVADPLAANSMQLAEIELIGELDKSVSIQATVPNASEGTPPTAGQFTISRIGTTSGLLTVDYTIAGSAVPADYAESLSGSVTIPDGAASTTLTITPVNDATSEAIETIQLTITPSGNYAVGAQNVATVTIADDGSPIASDTTVGGTGTITAQGENNGNGEGKENAFDDDVNTKWLDFADATPGSRASWIQYQYTGGERYVVTSYTLTSPQDQPARDPKDWSLLGSNDGVSFTALDTRTNEDFSSRSQTRTFNISNSTGYNVYRLDITSVADPASANSVQVAEIELIGVRSGAPIPPSVSIQATAPNAAEGTPAFAGQFTVTRTGSTSGPLTVNYAIAGSAVAADYFESLSGSVTIPNGVVSTTLAITPLDDSINEFAETVLLTISPDSNYTIGAQSSAVVTIADNDDPPTASDTTDAGTGAITAQGENTASNEGKDKVFDNDINTKWLDFADANPSTRASWIQYKYSGGDKYVVTSYTITSPQDQPARDPKDWSLSGSNDGVNFTELDTRTGEDFPDRFETRTFSFTNSTGYNIYRLDIASVADPLEANSVQIAEIELIGVPDAAPIQPTVSIHASLPNAAEGTPPAAGRFTVIRTGVPSGPLTVNYAIAGSAVAADYVESLTGSVVILNGASSALLPITPVDDLLVEPSETVVLSLSAGSGYSVGTQNVAVVTVTDNDVTPPTPPTVSIQATSPNAAEGTPPSPGQFTVTRAGATSGPLTVNYAIAGSAGSADYVESLTGSVVIPDGAASMSLAITPIDDSSIEGAETVALTISADSNYVVGFPIAATITISDNDAPLINYPSFPSASGLNLNGNASISGNQLQLTSSTSAQQAGTAFFNTPISINSSTSFQTAFSFQFGGGGPSGADGMAFLLQNSSAGANALGGSGGRLAYDNISNSVAIEFDSFKNPTDTGANTIAVARDGNWKNELIEAPAGVDLNSGSLYHAWIDYNGSSNSLKVYLSTSGTKPATPKLTTQIALDQIVGSSAYVGFGAGNYSQPDYHRVASWTFSTTVPDALKILDVQVPQDVNDDGNVSALDALIIIDQLNATAEGEAPSNLDGDVNGDNQVTRADALAVVNYMAKFDASNFDETEDSETSVELDDDDIRLLAEDVANQLA